MSVSEIEGESLSRSKGSVLAGQPDFKTHLEDFFDETQLRVYSTRMNQAWQRSSPDTPRIKGLLEFWARRGILKRHWILESCRRCKGTYSEPALNISRSIRCPGCGSHLSLPKAVRVGYVLDRAVRQAIKQGIIPVVLTGQVLHARTHKGFKWLPGVKYDCGKKSGDLDIVACCDGELVVAECKSLVDTKGDSKAWDEVVKQFRETVDIAETCGASRVILSALCEEFPKKVRQSINKFRPGDMELELLDRQRLEPVMRH